VTALHLATSRSAVVRLSPVRDALRALGAPQAVADVGRDGGSAAVVAAATEAAIGRARPGAALVAGDGDAAVTAALVCARLGVPIARVGAGLRCGDRGVVEEVNRLVLDGLADRLYADGEEAERQLRAEGVGSERIRCVGTTLADVVARRRASAAGRAAWRTRRLAAGRYVLATLRRPENIADDQRLARIVEALAALARRVPVVLCPDAVARSALKPHGDLRRLRAAGVAVVDGVDHVDFLSLQMSAGAVVTDSASVQEETTLMGVACFTARRATERTLTLTHGTNVLLGDDPAEIADLALGPPSAPPRRIPLWDGRAGRRIAGDLVRRSWGGDQR
jgi:UDP-N-acetylglucosamine 2-epimerase (non-hydrolysing)